MILENGLTLFEFSRLTYQGFLFFWYRKALPSGIIGETGRQGSCATTQWLSDYDQDQQSMITYFDYPHVVTHDEIDELDHAGNIHYIKWMQEAAIAHSAANGWPAERYIELGAGWVVRSHDITYVKPAFEGDSIIVKTWVSSARAVTSLRRYEILRNGEELLATARTDWAFVNYARQKPIRIPEEVASCFALGDES